MNLGGLYLFVMEWMTKFATLHDYVEGSPQFKSNYMSHVMPLSSAT